MSINTSIIIDIFVLIAALIGLLTSSGILFLIIYHQHRPPINIPSFLICNTYISMIFICLILLDMHIHNLTGDLYENLSYNDWWCYVRAYLLHVGLSLLYHSYLIQSIFRFFRVVFYRNKKLQTFQFMFYLVLIQWLIGFIAMLPFLFLHYFHYISQYYYCEVLLSDTEGILSTGGITYYFPMFCIGIIYVYIIYYMKKTKSQSVLQNRQQSNQRDLVVLRRIIILIGLLIILCFPTVLIWLGYIFTGYVNPIGYKLGWTMFTFSLSILPLTSAFLTPQLRNLIMITWRKNPRIQPITINQ
jgi:hypothetical protein